MIKKLNKGILTEDERLELEQINEILSEDYGNKVLVRDAFEKINDATLISEYFADTDDLRLSSKYEKIEVELGLVEDGNLKVDYSFYKKTMSNYTKKQHDEIKREIRVEIEKSTSKNIPVWGKPNPMYRTPLQQQADEVGVGDETIDDLFA